MGADDLIFRDLRIDNVGTAFRVTADLGNLHIEDIDANNVRRFFEDYSSAPSGTATITGLTIRNVDVEGFSRVAIRLQYDTNNVVIDNVTADMAGKTGDDRSEEHTSEIQSLMRTSYADFCLNKKKQTHEIL